MPREAVLRKFKLYLHDGKTVIVHDARVVKDVQRHMIHLEGNPFRITLIRDGDKRLYAHSEDLGIFSLVNVLPEFMIRLLS